MSSGLDKLFFQKYIKILKDHNIQNKENIEKYINLNKIEENINIINLNSSGEDKELYKYYENRYLNRYRIINESDTNKKLGLLSPQYEDIILSSIFQIKDVQKIYHYTSYEALFHILNSQSIRLTCMSGLNDRNELSFSEEVLKREIKQPFHHKRIEAFNKKFVLSCSLLQDNLNQWRLYGNDGRGVCIEFSIKNYENENYQIGKIHYGSEILDKIIKMIENIYKSTGIVLYLRNLNLWNGFIKDSDYSAEEEVRFIYLDNDESIEKNWNLNSYGLLTKYAFLPFEKIPLEITKVILGPKVFEPELNQGQLKQYLKEKGMLKYKNVNCSRIKHYR